MTRGSLFVWLGAASIVLGACSESHGTDPDGGRLGDSGSTGAECFCACGTFAAESELLCGDVCASRCGPATCAPASPRAADLLCPPSVTAGTFSRLDVLIGGPGECFCGETVSCSARVSPATSEVELTTTICSGDLLCDGCFPFVQGTCELPMMAAGEWTVRSGGEDLFVLRVADAGVTPEWGLACQGRADSDGLGCGTSWPPVPHPSIGRVCHPSGAYPETRVPVTVTDTCAGCGTMAGPCDVEVFDDVVRVRPTQLRSLCDVDCPAVCMEAERTCVTPPLPAGTWRVFLGTVDTGSTIVVDPSAPTAETCVDTAAP